MKNRIGFENEVSSPNGTIILFIRSWIRMDYILFCQTNNTGLIHFCYLLIWP